MGPGPRPAGVVQAVSRGVSSGADDDHRPVPVHLLHSGWSLGEKAVVKYFQEEPLRSFFMTVDPTFARDRVSHAVPGRIRLGIRQAPQ